jgi:hypothetical protein
VPRDGYYEPYYCTAGEENLPTVLVLSSLPYPLPPSPQHSFFPAVIFRSRSRQVFRPILHRSSQRPVPLGRVHAGQSHSYDT